MKILSSKVESLKVAGVITAYEYYIVVEVDNREYRIKFKVPAYYTGDSIIRYAEDALHQAIIGDLRSAIAPAIRQLNDLRER